MTRPLVVLIRALLLALLVATAGFAQTASPYLSVKDFGAKGDGQGDDTQALQEALKAAGQSLGSGQLTVYYSSNRTLFLPAGHYRVSKALEVGAYTMLLGEQSIIEQTDPEQDILHCMGYRNEFSGLTFLRGKRHVVIKTGNIDTCTPRITRCQFMHSAGPAVETEEPSNSTLLVIRDCFFIQCDQVLVNRCDKAVVQDCWVTTASTMKDRAVFTNFGVLHLDRLLGVPLVERDNDQRWVDNYSCVSCTGCRFGGESAGLCVINNLATYDHTYPVWPTYIHLDNCDIYALGNPKRKAAIYCVEVPNQIVIRGCHGLCDLPLLAVDPAVNLDTYFEKAGERGFANLRYSIEDSSCEIIGKNQELPAQMQKYQSRP